MLPGGAQRGRGRVVNLHLMSMLCIGHLTHPILSNFHSNPMRRHYYDLTDEGTEAKMFSKVPKRFFRVVHGPLGSVQDSLSRSQGQNCLHRITKMLFTFTLC